MASFDDRVTLARRMARHPCLVVTDLEHHLGTRNTAATLAALTRRFSRTRFVWLMGADNLIQLPRWQQWRRILDMMPLAVFRRPPYSLKALNGLAARRYRPARLPWHKRNRLFRVTPPVWVVLRNRLHGASATALRQRAGARSATGLAEVGQSGPGTRRSDAPVLPSPRQIKAVVEASLDQDQAEDVVVIDLAGRTSIADFMVIASGRSTRHVGALAENLMKRLKDAGVPRVEAEGLPHCDWVLIDPGDVIVHLFRPEVRQFYNLEKMWRLDEPTEVVPVHAGQPS